MVFKKYVLNVRCVDFLCLSLKGLQFFLCNWVCFWILAESEFENRYKVPLLCFNPYCVVCCCLFFIYMYISQWSSPLCSLLENRENGSVCKGQILCAWGREANTQKPRQNSKYRSPIPVTGDREDRQISGAQSLAIQAYIVTSRPVRDPVLTLMRKDSEEMHLNHTLASTCTYTTTLTKPRLIYFHWQDFVPLLKISWLLSLVAQACSLYHSEGWGKRIAKEKLHWHTEIHTISKHKTSGVRDRSQRQSACLLCARPWVQFSGPSNKNQRMLFMPGSISGMCRENQSHCLSFREY